MVFQGCSDVVESRVEHPILDAESRRNAASTSDSKQPRRASPWGTRGLVTTTRRGELALSIDHLSDLSNDHPQEKLNPRDFGDRREQKEVITYARWKPLIGGARAEQLRDADETHFLARDESEPFVN